MYVKCVVDVFMKSQENYVDKPGTSDDILCYSFVSWYKGVFLY